MKLILKEDLEDELNIEPESNEEVEINAPLDIEVNEEVPEEESVFIDETDPKLTAFVVSDELNALRDILIELPEDTFITIRQ